MKGETARLFVAFDVPDDVADFLEAAGRGLDGRFFRQLKRKNYHVTLAFLGDTPNESLSAIRECLDAAASETRAFEAGLGGPGAFPHAGEPRVVWYGLAAGVPEAGILADLVRRRLKKAGIPFDGKPFRAHVTLAYLRRGLGREATERAGSVFTDFLRHGGGGAANQARFAVREIQLIESELRPGGSEFTIVARYPLVGK